MPQADLFQLFSHVHGDKCQFFCHHAPPWLCLVKRKYTLYTHVIKLSSYTSD
jgi:hypothetical protein